MWLLCTGQPSCGKTTLVKKALGRISEWQSSVDDDADRDRKHANNASNNNKIMYNGRADDGWRTAETAK